MSLKNHVRAYQQEYIHKKKRQREIQKFEDPRRVAIYSTIYLNSEQEKAIDNLYMVHYGQKIPYTWHKHYTAFTGKFDPLYFPELLFIPEFERYMNPDRGIDHTLEDKNLLKLISGGVGIRMPETIVSCTNGILCDKDHQIIQWDDVVDMIPEHLCFAKPTVNSDSGRGCMLIDKNQKDILPKLKDLGNDFVVQERLVCSDSIQKIYSESVNTFRVMTYIWDNKIQYAPVIMRIGRNGSFLDNAHAGGMFIAVNPDGTLHKTAFTEFKNEFVEHPNTHVAFEGYQIKNFEKVIQSAQKMHAAMSQLGVINWDFTIDENEQPVLIEANILGGSIWLFQMAWGRGVFGENTIPILEWLKRKNVERAPYRLI